MSHRDAAELRRKAMPEIRASLEENSIGTLPHLALGRGELLWSKYMPSSWTESLELFSTATGLSVQEYYRVFAAIMTRHVDIRPQNLTSDTITAGLFDSNVWNQFGEINESFRRLLSNLSIPIERLVQLASGDDRNAYLQQLRSNPILRTKDGRYIILDAVFFTAQAAVGPLFAIAAVTRNRGPRSNECFLHFGEAFESYVSDLVSNRYPNSPLLAERSFHAMQLRHGKKIVGDIDVAIVTGAREICLFETKAVFVPAVALNNVDEYHAAIRSKYSLNAKHPKGVGQLGQIVRLLADNKLDGLPDALREVRKIETVLMVYDKTLDAPGHPAFLRRRRCKHPPAHVCEH